MRRREFIAALGGAAAWPFATQAQQGGRKPLIGVLMPFPPNDVEGVRVAAFRQELHKLGWSDDNARYDVRWAEIDNTEQVRATAIELVAAGPDVILVYTTRALVLLQKATQSIPIVFVGVSDPVRTRLVESLARPGGNTTGFTIVEYSVIGKMLEALKSLAPAISRVGICFNHANPSTDSYVQVFVSTASSIGIQSTVIPIRSAEEIAAAIKAFSREPNGGLLFPSDATIVTHRTLVTSLCAEHGLPAIYGDRTFVERGGLICYGSDRVDQFRRAASYVNRIIRGEAPKDLPVQQPTKYELVINLKTARALGLDVPPSLLARADEVIE